MCILWPHWCKGKSVPGWVHDYIFVVLISSPCCKRNQNKDVFTSPGHCAHWSWPGRGCSWAPSRTGEEGMAWGWGSSRKAKPPECCKDWGSQAISSGPGHIILKDSNKLKLITKVITVVIGNSLCTSCPNFSFRSCSGVSISVCPCFTAFLAPFWKLERP